MRVRLREVAELAGVSEATVSRVLNDRPHVSARTRASVMDALRQLDGPLPGSSRRSSGLVAVLTPDFDNPIFPVMAQLIGDRLRSTGRLSIAGRTGSALEEPELLEELAALGVAGIIVISGMHADTTSDITPYRRLLEAGTAMVLMNGYRRSLTNAPFVSCDDRHAASLAVQHLASLGHRRIGFVSGPHRLTVVQRKLAGYRTALGQANIEFDPTIVVETMFSAEAGHAATRGLLDSGATAAVCASDELALGSIRGARDLGLDVPSQWSAIGYDDTTLMAYTDPPLTTVRQPVRAMCHAAADMLNHRLEGHPARVGEFLFRPELVVRGSTAPAAG